MGWRTQDNYDRAERERIRALPLRERYAWVRMVWLGTCLAAGLLLAWWMR